MQKKEKTYIESRQKYLLKKFKFQIDAHPNIEWIPKDLIGVQKFS